MPNDYQPGPKEQLLWDRLQQDARRDETVRLMPIVDALGMDHEMAKQYARKWHNLGLVKLVSGYVYLRFTRRGLEIDDLQEI